MSSLLAIFLLFTIHVAGEAEVPLSHQLSTQPVHSKQTEHVLFGHFKKEDEKNRLHVLEFLGGQRSRKVTRLITKRTLNTPPSRVVPSKSIRTNFSEGAHLKLTTKSFLNSPGSQTNNATLPSLSVLYHLISTVSGSIGETSAPTTEPETSTYHATPVLIPKSSVRIQTDTSSPSVFFTTPINGSNLSVPALQTMIPNFSSFLLPITGLLNPFPTLESTVSITSGILPASLNPTTSDLLQTATAQTPSGLPHALPASNATFNQHITTVSTQPGSSSWLIGSNTASSSSKITFSSSPAYSGPTQFDPSSAPLGPTPFGSIHSAPGQYAIKLLTFPTGLSASVLQNSLSGLTSSPMNGLVSNPTFESSSPTTLGATTNSPDSTTLHSLPTYAGTTIWKTAHILTNATTLDGSRSSIELSTFAPGPPSNVFSAAAPLHNSTGTKVGSSSYSIVHTTSKPVPLSTDVTARVSLLTSTGPAPTNLPSTMISPSVWLKLNASIVNTTRVLLSSPHNPSTLLHSTVALNAASSPDLSTQGSTLAGKQSTTTAAETNNTNVPKSPHNLHYQSKQGSTATGSTATGSTATGSTATGRPISSTNTFFTTKISPSLKTLSKKNLYTTQKPSPPIPATTRHTPVSTKLGFKRVSNPTLISSSTGRTMNTFTEPLTYSAQSTDIFSSDSGITATSSQFTDTSTFSDSTARSVLSSEPSTTVPSTYAEQTVLVTSAALQPFSASVQQVSPLYTTSAFSSLNTLSNSSTNTTLAISQQKKAKNNNATFVMVLSGTALLVLIAATIYIIVKIRHKKKATLRKKLAKGAVIDPIINEINVQGEEPNLQFAV